MASVMQSYTFMNTADLGHSRRLELMSGVGIIIDTFSQLTRENYFRSRLHPPPPKLPLIWLTPPPAVLSSARGYLDSVV